MKEENVIEKDMTPRLIQDLGVQFATENSNRKSGHGLYECQYCGTIWRVETTSIVNNRTRSCGCLIGKSIITHGLSLNKFYKTWNDMIRRCTNHKATGYKNYGGRGITVCDEWTDVVVFVAWCEATHPNVVGVTLDRIDNDKGYSPDNCTWSSRTIQNINQRMKSNNTSGYNGIIWNKKNSNWKAVIGINTKKVYLGYFDSKEEAVQTRDNYIIENNLPHKLSTDYKKEN